MKVSCTLAASVLAASAAALTSSASYASQDHSLALYHPPTSPEVCSSSHPKVKSNASKSVEKEKFSPKFDGLRFIETLVTAHR